MKNDNYSFETFADYDTVKGTILNLYYIALNAQTAFITKPDIKREKVLREALIQLSLSLAPKFYVIEDDKQKKYISYFLAYPKEFKNMVDYSAVFAVCQRVIEVLGITKIETARLNSWKAYTEVE